MSVVESYSVHGEAPTQPGSVLTPGTAGWWVRLARDPKNLMFSAHTTCCVLGDVLTCATWGEELRWSFEHNCRHRPQVCNAKC